jgi:4-hydroxybenzoate polyprenyltransferase
VTPTAPGISIDTRWSRATAELLWAIAASLLDRLRRGEGALLAINLSLIAYQGLSFPRSLVQAVVSLLVIGLMYAFNDLYDAPNDLNNPRKDRALISTYLEYRSAGGIMIFALKLVPLALALAFLGPFATVAATTVMAVNVAYSTVLKGVPVIDVAWCGLWGSLYAAIVGAPPALLVVVGLMTSVSHLFQTLDDRAADSACGITTTAVRSLGLSRNVLLALSVLLFAVLRLPLGSAWALTAFIPCLLFFLVSTPQTIWLLTKVYFGLLWLYLLEATGAIG